MTPKELREDLIRLLDWYYPLPEYKIERILFDVDKNTTYAAIRITPQPRPITIEFTV